MVTKRSSGGVLWDMNVAKPSPEIPMEILPQTTGQANPEAEAARDDALRHLFAELEAGHLDALEPLWDLCAKDLYGLALWRTNAREDAEDTVQEVFLRLVDAAKKRHLRRARSPFAYLLRMVHSAAIDTLRRKERWQRLHQAAEPEPLLLEADPERRVEARRVSGLLQQLPPEQREVVYLRHFLGLAFREVGRATGVPTFTAASRYRLALNRLRTLLGADP